MPACVPLFFTQPFVHGSHNRMLLPFAMGHEMAVRRPAVNAGEGSRTVTVVEIRIECGAGT